jgi:hypothetical protein
MRFPHQWYQQHHQEGTSSYSLGVAAALNQQKDNQTRRQRQTARLELQS